MSTPPDPRRGNSADRPDDVEDQLRTSLERHAFEAPDASLVAERILHAADRTTARSPRRRWVSWGPSLAAAMVLFVIGGVVLAVTQLGSSGGPDTAAASANRTSSSPATPTPSSVQSAPVVAPAPASKTSTPQSGPTTLHNIQLVDLTFNGVNSGWALGSAECVLRAGRCTALLHTSDGRTWQPRPGAQFNVPGVNGCKSPCVSHIRFANDKVGYAYGPDAFFMTTDGGTTWVLQGNGGAVALETLDGNVVRVVSSGDGCAGGSCDVRVQTSAIGGTTWTTRDFGQYPSTPVFDVSLSRSGSDVYLLFQGRQSSIDLSRLYHSSDDGVTWTSLGEPCQPVSGARSHGVMVAASPHGRVSVVCWTAGSIAVTTSVDHGLHFTTRGSRGLAGDVGYLAGDPATVLAAGGESLSHSANGGNTWTTVPGVDQVTFVGFESPTVGRALADNGRTLWTTRDAGRHWTKVALG